MGQVTVTLTGDEARILRSFDKLLEKERELARRAAAAGAASAEAARKAEGAHAKLGDRLKGVGSEYDRTGKAGKDAFGAGTQADLAKYAGRVLSIGAAVGGLVSVLNQARDAARQLASVQRGAEGGISQLAQLAGGNPEKMRTLGLQSRALYARGVGSTLNEAAGVIFQLESAGINDPGVRKTFADLGQSIADPVGFARSAKTLQAALGTKNAGSIRDILSKAFQASTASPAQTPELLEAAAGSAAFASTSGVGIDELLAATAITATKSGSASVGGTHVSAFLKALGTKEETRAALQSGGLVGALDYLRANNLTSQAAFMAEPNEGGFGKRSEAFVGMRSLLEGRDNLFADSLKIRMAPSQDLVGKIGSSLSGDPLVVAARAARMAEVQKELAGSRTGRLENLFQASLDRREAQIQGMADGGGLSGAAGQAGMFAWRALRPVLETTAELPGQKERFVGTQVDVLSDAERASVEVSANRDTANLLQQYLANTGPAPVDRDPGD